MGDNKTEATQTIQDLIDSCSSVTFLSGGRYLSRQLRLSHSNISLLFQHNSTLVAWGDINTWNTSAARESLIYADDSALLSNVTVMGIGSDPSSPDAGRIDGQGWRWWPFGKTIFRPRLLSLPFGTVCRHLPPATLPPVHAPLFPSSS